MKKRFKRKWEIRGEERKLKRKKRKMKRKEMEN